MTSDYDNDISQVLQSLETGGVAGRFDPVCLRIFLEELFRWNPRLGLVSKQDTARVVTALIGQSVRLWGFVRGHLKLDASQTRCRVADIGTGGGFPGMIWALLEPRLDLTLIDRKVRKTVFLERVATRTGAPGVDVIAIDLMEAARHESLQGTFDVIVTMAVAKPDGMAGAIARLLDPRGVFCTVRSAGEPDPPTQIGDLLTRRAAEMTTDGWFVLYQQADRHAPPGAP
jgi:16S rRNA (guanine527-N7)-methyltransferase